MDRAFQRLQDADLDVRIVTYAGAAGEPKGHLFGRLLPAPVKCTGWCPSELNRCLLVEKSPISLWFLLVI